jgi:hypothetical protein
MTEKIAPRSPIKIEIQKGLPGRRGSKRYVFCREEPFAVCSNRTVTPAEFMLVAGYLTAPGKVAGWASVCMTEEVARQLVKDLTDALDSPG